MKRSDWIAIGVVSVVSAALVAFGVWWTRREAWIESPLPMPAKAERATQAIEERNVYRGKFDLPGIEAGKNDRKEKRGMGALPGGFVKTGHTASGTNSATLQVFGDTNLYTASWEYFAYLGGWKTLQETIDEIPDLEVGNRITFMDFSVYAIASGAPDASAVAIILVTPTGTRHVLELHEYDDEGYHAVLSSPVTVTYTISGLIEGASYGFGGSSASPLYSSKHGRYEYKWFGDANTQIVSSCAGYTHTENPYTTETEIGHWAGGVMGYCAFRSIGVDAAIFSNVTASGEAVDFTGLHDGCLVGSGNTAVGNSDNGSTSIPPVYSGRFYFAWPIIVNLQGSLPKWGGVAADDWAQVITTPLCTRTYDADGTPREPYFEYLTFPSCNGRYVFPYVSWENGFVHATQATSWTMSLRPEWVADSANRVSQSDIYIPIRGIAPNGAKDWQAITFSIQNIDVLRPDGCRPSDFVTADDTKLVVTEGSSATTFNVLDKAAAQATRTFNVEWRDWIDKPANQYVTPNPKWSVDGYTRTKHTVGYDVFWWQTYGKARIKLSLPDGVTRGSFTLRADYTHLYVSDLHVSSAWSSGTAVGRVDTMEFYETAGWAEWKVSVGPEDLGVDGAYYTWIDLLFPTNSSDTAPVYLGRVDSLRVSNFSANGKWVLHEILLSPKNINRTHFSFAVGDPKNRSTEAAKETMTEEQLRAQDATWPTVMLAVDGSYWAGDLPDQERKQDMTGAHGGSTRYVEPITGSASGLILDVQFTISQFVDWLNRTEGVEWVYAEGERDAACKDSDGNELVEPLVDWIEPYVLDEGGAFELRASIACRTITFTAGREHILRPYTWLWGAQQTLVATTDLGRLPEDESVNIYAVENTGGEKRIVAGPVSTNQDGLATVFPVPAPDDPDYTVCLMTEDEVEELELI